jgi:hypothetical protein
MEVVGGIYCPNHQCNRWQQLSVDGHTGHDTVYCLVSATSVVHWSMKQSIVGSVYPCDVPDSLVAHWIVRCDLIVADGF